jgi:cyanophycinase-like exopeptidase
VSARALRLLALMGSGETAPTMVTTHREVVARFGETPPRAVLLDTPYGFQENAAEITQRAIEYFAHRVQLVIEAAGLPGPLAVDPAQRTPLAETAALSRLRTADLIFAGPGSPSYALSVWRTSPVPETLASKLVEGGAVVFASAAALTLGRFSVPVYEVYKVGQAVHWLEGLDLLGRIGGFGGPCAVIPHFDNAEGGTHDTRFCYLGERRLAAMEAMLPDDGWVLGIDEHTALIIDLDARMATVTGRGTVTVRRKGASWRLPAGQRVRLDALLAAARGETVASDRPLASVGSSPEGTSPPTETSSSGPKRSPLLAEVTRLEQVFETALAGRSAAGAAEAILHLDRTIQEWATDSLQTDDPDQARAVLRSLVHRLGEAAGEGLRDPRELLAPLVENLLALRAELRVERAWALADRLRAQLAAARIELHDTPNGTLWELRQ